MLIVFSVVVFVDRAQAQEDPNQVINYEVEKERLSPDSPFLDQSPRIDEEAAFQEKTDAGQENYQVLSHKAICRTLPQNMWVLTLAAYVFLLIFNLTYGIDPKQKTRWFWEALYTILALLAWYTFDECKSNTWFAQSVILIGLTIYFFYLYHFKKYQAQPNLKSKEDENTAQLPLK